MCENNSRSRPNHNGNINLVYKLVGYRLRDPVLTTLNFKRQYLVSIFPSMLKSADYQKRNTNKNQSQLDMSKKMTLNFKNLNF